MGTSRKAAPCCFASPFTVYNIQIATRLGIMTAGYIAAAGSHLAVYP